MVSVSICAAPKDLVYCHTETDVDDDFTARNPAVVGVNVNRLSPGRGPVPCRRHEPTLRRQVTCTVDVPRAKEPLTGTLATASALPNPTWVTVAVVARGIFPGGRGDLGLVFVGQHLIKQRQSS